MAKTIYTLLFGTFLALPTVAGAQIRLNQVGMYPNQEKIAVVEGTAKSVTIKDAATGRKAVKPRILRTATSPWSGKKRTVIDFSSLTQPGTYTICSGKESATFTVKEGALRDVTAATLKAFYLIRSGVAIEAKYAGAYARPVGHPDTKVLVHPSAASLGRPAGSIISSPGGWYDAGDYNKYIVNSAFSIGIMLCSYEQNRDYYQSLTVNIPESQNQTADLLDELYFNLRWMLTMQDPYDGGVYHKLTTPNFESFILPTDCKQQRYVVQKSTAATLDFAAVMAQAARIYKGNKDYPTFADEAARAAMAAYGWAERNPRVLYQQRRLTDPAVSTGEYGDFNTTDEWYWAATELYLLTGDQQFADIAVKNQPRRFSAPTWGNVAALGTYDWLTQDKPLPSPVGERLRVGELCSGMGLGVRLLSYCDSLVATTSKSSFQTPCGNSPRDFGWGCLAETFGANGVTLCIAYRLTGDKKYLTAALENADYVLGRNATGYCYITGFGTKSPMHPHHRISAADNIEAPFPGMVAGGPNPQQQDIAEVKVYPSKQPDESYTDVTDSYASNEIAINWNASILALLGWLEAELQ